MADNTTLNSGSGGDTISTDDLGAVKVQRVKVQFGADGAASDVESTTTNPLPVALSDTDNAVLDTIAGAVHNEDSAHTTADAGIQILGVRQDTQADFGADGDYVPLSIDADGAIRVNAINAEGTQTDDAAFTPGTSTIAVLGAFADETATDSVDEGDAGAVRMSLDRRLLVDAQIAGQDADVTIADGGNSITVDGTVTANLSATDNAVLDTIETNTDFGAVTGGGTEASALRVTLANDSTGVVSVDDNGGSLTVDGSVSVTGAALTALQLIDNSIVAHDAAASGSTGVNMAGGVATNSIEGRTQVANNDASRIVTDLNGVQVTRPHTTLEENISERVSDTGGTSTAFTNFAAGGAGVHNYICDVTITNTSSTDGYVDLRDGTAGSVIWTFPAPANSGATHSFSLPLKGAANTALAFDVSAALTTVYIAVNGFQAQG